MQKTSDNLSAELTRLESVFSSLSERLTQAAEQFRQVGVSPAPGLVIALAEYKQAFNGLAGRVLDYARETSLPSEQTATLSASTLDDLKNSIRTIAEFEERCRREALKDSAAAALGRALCVVRTDGIAFPPLSDFLAITRALRGEILSHPGPDLHPAVRDVTEGTHPIARLVALVEDEGALSDEECLNCHEAIAQSLGQELAIAATRGKLELRPSRAADALPEKKAWREAPADSADGSRPEALESPGQDLSPELESLLDPPPSPAPASPLHSDSSYISTEPGTVPESKTGSTESAERLDAMPAEPTTAVETKGEYAHRLPAGKPSAGVAAAAHGASAVVLQPGSPGSFARPKPATIAGRYELREELGTGGGGAVYKAVDLQTRRTVAVKVLYGDGLSPEQLRLHKERMWREASIAGEIRHAGIVTVLDIDDDEAGHPYIVMDFVDGGTLEETLSRADGGAPPDLAQRLDIAIQLCRTLEYAHSKGVVHRDIKPSNILVGSDGHVKIADFGIALLAPVHSSPAGELPGTPAFIAPELLSDVPANAASDIFSLGVVLYWMFTGQMPFAGRTVTEITWQIANTEPLPARQLNWALPQELEAILARCLAKNPAGRYASAALLAEDLAALRDSRSHLPRHVERFVQKAESSLRTQ